MYNYKTMEQALSISKQKNKIGEILGVTYPTVCNWIKKYNRDKELIESEVGQYNDEYKKLKRENKLMKQFIQDKFTINGNLIRNSQIILAIKNWDLEKTKKLKKSFNNLQKVKEKL